MTKKTDRAEEAICLLMGLGLIEKDGVPVRITEEELIKEIAKYRDSDPEYTLYLIKQGKYFFSRTMDESNSKSIAKEKDKRTRISKDAFFALLLSSAAGTKRPLVEELSIGILKATRTTISGLSKADKSKKQYYLGLLDEYISGFKKEKDNPFQTYFSNFYEDHRREFYEFEAAIAVWTRNVLINSLTPEAFDMIWNKSMEYKLNNVIQLEDHIIFTAIPKKTKYTLLFQIDPDFEFDLSHEEIDLLLEDEMFLALIDNPDSNYYISSEYSRDELCSYKYRDEIDELISFYFRSKNSFTLASFDIHFEVREQKWYLDGAPLADFSLGKKAGKKKSSIDDKLLSEKNWDKMLQKAQTDSSVSSSEVFNVVARQLIYYVYKSIGDYPIVFYKTLDVLEPFTDWAIGDSLTKFIINTCASKQIKGG